MSQKPLPKVYDRPERKTLSPALLGAIIVVLVIIASFMTYRMLHHAASPDAVQAPMGSQNNAMHASPVSAPSVSSAGRTGTGN